MLKEFIVPVSWEVSGVVKVRATSLKEAIEKAKHADLPEGYYIDGSFRVDDIDEVEETPITIAWAYMNPAEDGLSKQQAMKLLGMVPDEVEVIPFDNQTLLEANSVAIGFLDNEFYEELESVKETLAAVCNDLTNEREDHTYITPNGYKVIMLCDSETV